MSPRAASVTAALVVALVGAPLVQAETSSQVRTLAERAAGGDAAALAQLRSVSVVDGRPLAVGDALAGASGSDLTARLHALAGDQSPSSAAGDPSADAAAILSGRRFQEDTGVRPFRGPLRRLGDGLRRVVGGPYSWVAERFPGGRLALDIVLAVILLAAIAFVARLVSSRGGGVVVGSSSERRGAPREGDPAALESEADAAEQQGDLELALRLRFRAGLVRLERAGSIPRGQRTSRELRRALRAVEFDRLSRRFDEIVYGRRAPSRADVEEARSDWRIVLDRAGAR
jgi:hypothetical protein